MINSRSRFKILDTYAIKYLKDLYKAGIIENPDK